MSRHKQDPSVSRVARRSMDNLSLNTQNMASATSGYPIPQFNPARRMSKSEQTSPKLRPSLFGNFQGLSDNQLSAVDFVGLDSVKTNDTAPSTTSESGFQQIDPMSALADNFFDPWSAYPSGDSQTMPNNNPFGVWPTSLDLNGIHQPALTAASSGTQSEADEIPAMEDVFEPGMPSIQEDVVNPNGDPLMPGNPNQGNRRSLPPSFFGNTDFAMSAFNNWPTQLNAYDNMGDKTKAVDLQTTSMFDDAWQMPVSQPTNDAPLQPLGGLPMSSNARSIPQSTGTSTPPDDIMRTLFPEMDFDNDAFVADNAYKPTTQSSAPSLNGGMDLGALSDQEVGFAAQSWTDGSLSVPNDPFTSTYAFPNEYSGQSYAPGWNQYV